MTAEMTITQLWDIYYHAMKQWIPKASDQQIRVICAELLDFSKKKAVEYKDKNKDIYWRTHDERAGDKK